MEIDFSAIARMALKKRIPTKEQLESQVLACVKERTKKWGINWQFDIAEARSKMNRHYVKINVDNEKYKLI